ncbi:MAG: YebC/PmpR family DNA-binding transcriptional regulator [Verrucomicrobiales bacterium]|nr:YebC/PmpR family DNA-binding transcriptional regulator [Verrucomicrobiales bacterium]|tara:strand:+ start:4023 stop:4748 length:726 start_codon:yes stop_codon:yes gene_type:complete
MAGHSKWANIKRAKGANDAKRGKVFAKLSREVTIAARVGGGDPDMNPRLRMILLKCRAANMPKDNIDRAINKGAGGDDGTQYEDLIYEIYGPNGVAILAEISTDNRNRTASDIRSYVTKSGGNIATAGAVTRLFQKKGQIVVARESADEDTLMELALEAGAEDMKSEPEGFTIITEPDQFETVNKAIEEKEIKAEVAEISYIPDITVPLDDKSSNAVTNLIEKIEDHDDVNSVYSNAEFAE